MRASPYRLAALAIVVAVALVPLFADNYLQYLVNLVLVYAVIGIGLNFLLGYAGQFAFAHAAFMGIGAYVVCIFTTRLGISYWIALPAAGLVATAVGAVAALPALRMRRVYLALATLAFAELTVWVFVHWDAVTLGTDGIGLENPSFFGRELRTDKEIFYLIFGVFIVMYLAAWRILHSRIGRAFVAIKESELVAQCNGISVARTKAVAFCLSAFYGGIGGALFALSIGFISPENFGLNQIALHFSIIVIGGLGSLPGSVIGAAVVTLLPEFLRAVQGIEELVYGVMLMLFILFMPGGIASLLRKLRILPAEVLAASRSGDLGPGAAATLAGKEKPAGSAMLDIDRLTVRFGGLTAVSGASVTLARGQIRGLIGPNGAGKSTLFNAVSGLVPIAGGTIRLDGTDITSMAPHARANAGIRRTFQSVHLIPSRTVLENVLTGLHAETPFRPLDFGWLVGRDRAETEARTRVVHALQALGIEDTLMREVQTLSFAEQRFVEIARAIVADPPLLLLDEPAAGLSPVDIARFTEVVNRLRTGRMMSILLVEHVISLVTDLCDRVSVLDDGELIAEGTPQEIVDSPVVRAAYLGEFEHA